MIPWTGTEDEHPRSFARADDETASCGGTLTCYARKGVEIYVVTITRGNQGSLETDRAVLTQEELSEVREAEMRTVLQLPDADFCKLAPAALSIMQSVNPGMLITLGASVISRYSNHIAVHRAAVEGFHRYRRSDGGRAQLFHSSMPAKVA